MEKTFTLGNTEIYNNPNEKFKTAVVEFTFFDALSRERAYKNNLLVNVLRSGCEEYKNTREIEKRLQELYGAYIMTSAYKLGEIQMLRFSLLFTEEKYLGTQENLFEKAVGLLTQVIFRPYLENGAFSKEIFEREKENLNDEIRAEFNDKQGYAFKKLFEIGYEGEPFAYPSKGNIEDGEGLTEKNLYEYYRDYFLKKLKVCVFCHSMSDMTLVKDILEKNGYYSGEDTVGFSVGFRKYTERETVRKTESFEVSQAKLNVLYRTDIDPESDERYALSLAMKIFGGGFNSMLNRTVREKNSLAYYISASYLPQKGGVVVYCGIDEKNSGKTEALISEELENLKNGRFTSSDIKSALKKIKSNLESIGDSQYQIIDREITGMVYGKSETPEESLKKYEKVSKKQIMKAAAGLKQDTVLLIKGTDKEA